MRDGALIEEERRTGSTESDDSLIGRVNAGDDAAWRTLVDRHMGPVFGQAWRMLSDRAEAEDVAQETFVRLMRKAPDWQPGGARLKTWLFRVAINLCIDRQRARRTVALDDAPEIADRASDPAATDRGIDMRHAVGAALKDLPERQRAALVMAHYQGFSNIECAEALDLSVDALESLLARARRALRRTLAPLASEMFGEGQG